MNRIKTKLKFAKSNVSDALVGFVSINNKNGRMKGVRENADVPKMICLTSNDVAPSIEQGVLYDVEMIPMNNASSGFIVVKAEPHKFNARISSSIVKNAVYVVEVKFGNKTIVFNPLDGKKDSIRTIDGVLEVLSARKDIRNIEQVLEDFKCAAEHMMEAYENDGHYDRRQRIKAKA